MEPIAVESTTGEQGDSTLTFAKASMRCHIVNTQGVCGGIKLPLDAWKVQGLVALDGELTERSSI